MNIRRFDKWDDMINEYNNGINQTAQEQQALNAEKQATLDQYNANYNQQLNDINNLTAQQQAIADQYEKNQNQILENNYQSNLDTINKNRQETKESIDKEKKDAYVDYMKQSNQYGGAAETLASQGLAGTGYSESSKVAMYSTYQNRVSAANTALTKANVEYDRQMQEAKDNYDVGLAEVALNKLQQSYTIALQGFEYRNTLFNNKTNFELQVNDSYFNKGQTLQNRVDNYRTAISNVEQYREKMAEDQRQFDETMAEKKREYDQNFAEEQRQFNEQMAYKNSSSGGSGGSSKSGYTSYETSIPGQESAYSDKNGQYATYKTIPQITNTNINNNQDRIQVAKPNKSAPKLSSSQANYWFDKISNNYNTNGVYKFKVSDLENKLYFGRDSAKVLTNDDCKKIASYFGLTWK